MTPKLELLEHPLSPYAQKVKIALNEKGVPFTTGMPAAIGSGNTPEAFRAANPRGEVPVLYVDGRPLFDSTIILEFIEDRFPETPLMPADPMARARARTIEEVCDTHYEAITWGLSEIANFKRATGEQAAAMQATAGEQLARLNGWLDKQLDGKAWLNGDTFGWADVCAAPFVQGAAGFGFGPAEGSALAGWLARVRARPSCAESFAQALASLEAMSQVAGIVEAGLFKRQYRDYRLEWMIRSGGIDVVLKGLEKDNIRFNQEPAA
ncbi:MAG: glutathione S-transferase family protein [Caulobacter sp.]|nr:glutathione S-transferase family protein [Caulobacter sp.]